MDFASNLSQNSQKHRRGRRAIDVVIRYNADAFSLPYCVRKALRSVLHIVKSVRVRQPGSYARAEIGIRTGCRNASRCKYAGQYRSETAEFQGANGLRLRLTHAPSAAAKRARNTKREFCLRRSG
jgi:hypothetical protein